MKYIITPLIGLLLTLVSLVVAPFGMLVAVWFIRWDDTPTNGSYGQDPTIRGDLPHLLRWFQTPDERFPGGLYEPTVAAWLASGGKSYCSYMWAGWRNQMMGMAAAFGKPATDYIPEGNGFWSRDDIWRYSLPLGPIRIVTGWQVYRRLDGTFLAVPVCTLKRN
jgi:hypothetical protein